MNEAMTTEVWRLKGAIGSTPGLLHHQDGTVRLELLSDDDELDQVFALPLDALSDVKWPKLQMSGGCSFEANGEKYRISFLKPQNTQGIGHLGAIDGIASISGGRSAGKAWKALLQT